MFYAQSTSTVIGDKGVTNFVFYAQSTSTVIGDKGVSNFVFYAQSTSTVLCGRQLTCRTVKGTKTDGGNWH